MRYFRIEKWILKQTIRRFFAGGLFLFFFFLFSDLSAQSSPNEQPLTFAKDRTVHHDIYFNTEPEALFAVIHNPAGNVLSRLLKQRNLLRSLLRKKTYSDVAHLSANAVFQPVRLHEFQRILLCCTPTQILQFSSILPVRAGPLALC